MSVAIATSQQPATWWQRLTGTEPKTVIRETSTTEVTSVPGGSFNLSTALRNGGIGAAVAGALGGVSLLGKIALPIIGKVGSLGGLVKLAGVGGALGVATAAIPLVAPKIQESPAAKATLVGAGIGAAAGAILPLMPTWLGAAIGAGVGLLVHHRRTHPAPSHQVYPGYAAYPGFRPIGTSPGDAPVPHGLVPVTPNYGAYAASAVNPYGVGAIGMSPMAGYGMAGYGMPGYGASMSPYGAAGYSLPMTAGQQGAGVPQPQVVAAQQPGAAPAPVAARPTGSAKFPNAKTWIDRQGNVRQVGTGKVLKPAAGAGAAAPVATAPVATGVGAAGSLGALTSPASYLPGMASSLPLSGMSPMTAGASQLGMLAGAMPQAAMGTVPMGTAAMGTVPTAAMATVPAGIAPTGIPARPTA
jgi:hypothetical protein